jgi:hypothetical protein
MEDRCYDAFRSLEIDTVVNREYGRCNIRDSTQIGALTGAFDVLFLADTME